MLPQCAWSQRYYEEPYYWNEGSDRWYREEAPLAFIGVAIVFIAPYFIARRQVGVSSRDFAAYCWKWYLIFLGAFVCVVFGTSMLGMRATTESFLVVKLIVAAYGLFFSKKY